MLRDIQSLKVKEALDNGEILSGRGLNQEQGLQRPGDTRWGSHYRTLISLIDLFSSILTLLDNVMRDGESPKQRSEGKGLLDKMYSFDFFFVLHLMRRVLRITSDLSTALQRKDQDMPNAIRLPDESKGRLQDMRDNGWVFDEISLFCETHGIKLLHMATLYLKGRSQRNAKDVDNLHHYRVDLFYNVVDMQLKELNDRFTETSELFICLSCFDPAETFSAFDKKKLIRLSQLYPNDFSTSEVVELDDQLENFIHAVRKSHDFSCLKGAGCRAEKLVDTRRNLVYSLVYRLLKLILLLPVATATVERVFSAMNIVKSNLRNRMGDEWLNNSLVTYIENEVFRHVEGESINQRFQNMKTRRGQL